MVQRNADWPSQSLPGAVRHNALPQVGEISSAARLAMAGGLLNPGDLPTAALDMAVVGDQYLLFSLLDWELAILAEHIQGVERLADVTPVPNVAPWIKGVINLRGSIASVVDLRAFLDLEMLPYNPRTRLLSVEYNEMVICLVVDSVSEMVPIPPASIVTDALLAGVPQRLAPYALGSALVGQRNVILLDLPRLLFSEKMQRYS
jgi:purine-binding chemotaxis protein CheW